MVVAEIEVLVLLECEVGDARGITARDEAVGVVGEEHPAQLVVEEALGVRERALHLAVHHAVAGEIPFIVHLVVPALLTEREGRFHAEGMEHGVHVDVDQVEEVLAVARADRVRRVVGGGPGVEERRKGALEQLHEWLLHGILLRSAQHGMLEDVGDTRVILGNRAERDREGHVVVVAVEPHEVGAAFRIGHPHERAIHLGNRRDGRYLESAHAVAHLVRTGGTGHQCAPNHDFSCLQSFHFVIGSNLLLEKTIIVYHFPCDQHYRKRLPKAKRLRFDVARNPSTLSSTTQVVPSFDPSNLQAAGSRSSKSLAVHHL